MVEGVGPRSSVKPALPCGVSDFSRTTVNQKVDPFPGVDVTPNVPDIRSTSCLLMASPRPEPPKLRVVLLST